MPKTDTVLNKMPRDCTEQGPLCGDEQSSSQLYPILDMNKNKNKKPQSARKSPAGGRSSNQMMTSVGVSYDTQIANSKPSFLPSKDGLRVKHREYVGDVGATTSNWSVVNTFSINPGLPSTFPWLSMLAQVFETYEVHSLSFVYQAALPTSTAGTVYLCIDYDPADPAPANKASMMSNMSAIACSSWASTKLTYVPQHDRLVNKFTRNSSLASSLDIKTYDAGQLFIAAEGFAVSSPGNVFVEYDITLRIPQIPTTIETAQSLKITYGSTSALSNVNDGYAGNSNLLNSLAGSLASGTGTGAWVCPSPGQYLLEYAISGTANSSGNVDGTWAVLSGAASITDLGQAVIPESTSALGIYQAIINVADAGATIGLALIHLASFANYHLRVSKYGYSLN